MKKFKQPLFTLLAVLFLSSCIQSEAPNAEADIDAYTVFIDKNIVAESPKGEYFHNKIGFYLSNKYKNKNGLYPNLTIELTPTEGASIYYLDNNKKTKYPPEGMPLDYNTNKKFLVESESKEYSKEYTVFIDNNDLPLKFSFEKIKVIRPTIVNSYYEFIFGEQENQHWSSGNPGFSLTGINKKPLDFPTTQDKDGVKGKCVKLITKETGGLGETVKMPIAAGNLFLGKFDTGQALTDALKATHFGTVFNKMPKSIKGHYKYQKGKLDVTGKPFEDIGDIYAVLYEAEDSNFYLNGANSLTSESIVSMARIGESSEPMIESNEWVEFSIPFKLKEGKTINSDKLIRGQYKLAIVCSSSIDGAYFKGAIGSTLWIDELEIEIEK